MTSKLITLLPHEAQIQLEVSLRDAYCVNQPKFIPPLKYMLLSAEEYLSINRAIVYGVLCEPNLANICIKYLHAHVNDGYCLFIKILVEIVNGLYSKLLEFPKVQLIWVASVMVDVSGVGFDHLFVSLLRQIVGGDFSDGNLWLSHEMVNLLLAKWDLILDEAPVVLGYGLYNYLRLLADHYRLPRSPKSTELKRREIGFCVKVLREQFSLCVSIGRDLVRLLQELVHIPEFRAIWRDLLMKPSLFGVSGFSDISKIYGMRTSSRYFLLRITLEMETQLRFLLTHVKLGTQRRHQSWFARKFLFGPERETLIADIVRFICCAHHPSNEVLQSEVVPRWAVIGWLLKSCTKKYIEASVKLALFYDWLFFDEKVDNFMNVEPAMLLMVNSIPSYIDITNSLLEFLLLLVENYDMDRKNVILKGVSSAMSLLVRKGVISSLDVLTSCNLIYPYVKKLLEKFMLEVDVGVLSEPPLPEMRPHKVFSSPSRKTSFMETQLHLPEIFPAHPVNAEVTTQENSVSKFINSGDSPGFNNVDRVEEVGYLIGKIGDSMKSSVKMGRQIVEKILLLCCRGTLEKMSYEEVACQIKKELELAGYKVFSSLENLINSDAIDEEVQSVTATIIRAFILNQHQRIKEMLFWWSKNGCSVGSRLLSYALRLSYEAHEGGYGTNSADAVDKASPLLKFHIEGHFAFLSRNKDDNETISSNFKVDKKVISKMIDDAYTAYRSIMFEHSSTAVSEDFDTSSGKLLCSHAMYCSLWRNNKLKFVFYAIFFHISDLSLGDEDLVQLLVSHLDDTDIVSVQIDLGLKRYALFGKDVEKVIHLVRQSICWNHADQLKFWRLATSELIISGFAVERLLLCIFFSEDLEPHTSGIVFGGLMTLCNCHAPTPETVGAVMLLPDNKFPDFAAAVLSNWAYTNQTMLSTSFADFLNKFENKTGDDTLDWDGIVVNQSAVLFLVDFIQAQSELGNNMLAKVGLNLPDIRTRLENSAVAMDTSSICNDSIMVLDFDIVSCDPFNTMLHSYELDFSQERVMRTRLGGNSHLQVANPNSMKNQTAKEGRRIACKTDSEMQSSAKEGIKSLNAQVKDAQSLFRLESQRFNCEININIALKWFFLLIVCIH
ncbi:hypothetical protein KSS87_005785 [Heliosperma pusillum]|nr:hypothetical protein KSS87_005785 [Heliosperma pusillum]